MMCTCGCVCVHAMCALMWGVSQPKTRCGRHVGLRSSRRALWILLLNSFLLLILLPAAAVLAPTTSSLGGLSRLPSFPKALLTLDTCRCEASAEGLEEERTGYSMAQIRKQLQIEYQALRFSDSFGQPSIVGNFHCRLSFRAWLLCAAGTCFPLCPDPSPLYPPLYSLGISQTKDQPCLFCLPECEIASDIFLKIAVVLFCKTCRIKRISIQRVLGLHYVFRMLSSLTTGKKKSPSHRL